MAKLNYQKAKTHRKKQSQGTERWDRHPKLAWTSKMKQSVTPDFKK